MSENSSATSRPQDRSGIQVIARATAILRTLAGEAEGLSLAEIARAVSLPRSTVHRIVSALADEGFVMAASPSAKVRLGPAFIQLAASLDYDSKKMLRPFLSEISRELQDTVDLAIPRGGSVLFVDQVIGRQRLVVVSEIGERFAFHCTANGKALLALMSDSDAERTIDRSLKEHPDQPLESRSRLWEELDRIRRDKLAYDLEENSRGVGAIGFALKDHSGMPFAITVTMPIQRLYRLQESVEAAMREHRTKIIEKLGLAID